MFYTAERSFLQVFYDVNIDITYLNFLSTIFTAVMGELIHSIVHITVLLQHVMALTHDKICKRPGIYDFVNVRKLWGWGPGASLFVWVITLPV